MIQAGTYVKIADNAGGKEGQVFKILGGSKRRYAQLGDVVILSIKKVEPRKTTKKKAVVKGVIVRQRKAVRRKDGSYIRFDENAVVIINAKGEPVGSRIFGPIPREVQDAGYQKIASLAPEVI